MHTHYLTWITMGQTAAAITTPLAQSLETHRRAVAEAEASYPDDEDGQPPDLKISEPYLAVAYRDVPDELVFAALDGTNPELQAIGHCDGETWYGREVN